MYVGMYVCMYAYMYVSIEGTQDGKSMTVQRQIVCKTANFLLYAVPKYDCILYMVPTRRDK
jgi:hypothetical protein